MLHFSPIYKKLFVIRLIFGLVALFCLPTNNLSPVHAKSGFFNDKFYLEQKYLQQINANAWLEKPGNSAAENNAVVVAVIDEGVDFSHPELQGLDSGQSWNFLDNNNQLAPKGPHGTRLAGIIAAKANNNEGIVGLTQKAKIMSLIACDTKLGCSPSAIIGAIYYAADNGASVINLSFGDTAGYSEIYTPAINYASQKGALIVAAAGGVLEGADLAQKPISPACNEPVIGVSSITETGQLPFWANFGNCVDVYVPGTNIFTATSAQFDGVNYGYFSGSSYSAAMVSGFLANIKFSNLNLAQSQASSLFKNQRLDVAGTMSLISQKTKPLAKVKGAKITKSKIKISPAKFQKLSQFKEKFR